MPEPCSTRCTDLDAVQVAGALLLTTQWPASQRAIRVGFLDGDPATHRLVAEVASEWNLHSGMRFTFPGINYAEARYASKAYYTARLPYVMRPLAYHAVITTPEDCDVRVSFDLPGIWSRMGVRALHHDGASMSLAGVRAGMDLHEAKRVILHEFGHALGMVHEHQHPENGIAWNEAEVFAWYVDHLGWTEAEVRTHIFTALDRDILRTGEYDADSIMHYGILEKYTTNGFSVPWPHDLSDGDKAFIAEVYPSG